MAIIFDNSADRISRSSDLLNYNAAYTFMAWVKLTTDINDFTIVWNLGQNDGGTFDFVGTDSNGTTLRMACWNVSQQVDTGSALSTGVWKHLAIVRQAITGDVIVYLDAVEDMRVTGNETGRNNIQIMEVGGFLSFNRWPGSVAYIRAWSAALNTTEIATEMNATSAQKTSSLYGDWQTPSGSTRVNDSSANARHWTAAGTLTDEANPTLSGGTKAVPFLKRSLYVWRKR